MAFLSLFVFLLISLFLNPFFLGIPRIPRPIRRILPIPIPATFLRIPIPPAPLPPAPTVLLIILCLIRLQFLLVVNCLSRFLLCLLWWWHFSYLTGCWWSWGRRWTSWQSVPSRWHLWWRSCQCCCFGWFGPLVARNSTTYICAILWMCYCSVVLLHTCSTKSNAETACESDYPCCNLHDWLPFCS